MQSPGQQTPTPAVTWVKTLGSLMSAPSHCSWISHSQCVTHQQLKPLMISLQPA